VKTNEIHIRDPFVLTDTQSGKYYMFGTIGRSCWSGPGEGFDCYQSSDLLEWDGPIPAFRPSESFWATTNFWAPEVHAYEGRYYMFATFKAPKRYRGTQILVSEKPWGPFEPLTEGPITPSDWECLDGTLHVDANGDPWIVFCHEWTQVMNGTICAMRLTRDLKAAAGRPVYLFSASEAPWVRRSDWPETEGRHSFPTYITDGPFLYRTSNGTLLMLWSSFGSEGYAMGFARSESGTIIGPWSHHPSPLWAKDGGHGMVFRTLDNRLLVTFHMPNQSPNERPIFVEVEDTGDSICLKSK
jgi:arabinan endo-1,5-alpha-L-arabinosidase